LVTVNIATSSDNAVNGSTTIGNLKVYAYSDSNFSSAVPGFTSGLLNATGVVPTSSGDQKIAFDSTVQVPAGLTYYFKVQGDVAQTGIASGSRHGFGNNAPLG